MATMLVKNASGTNETVEKPNANGRVAASASRPVVLSTEDKAALDAVASQTTLAAVLAKIIAAPATEATLAAILAKIIAAPATAANQATAIAAIATIGTRAYGAGQQVAIGAASAASTGLAATEVLLHASARCFIRVATAATAGAGIPLEAGEKFHLRLTSGQQIHVIRDTVDGVLNIVPVA